jgi:cytochrome o ubiquinol oxidase subunit II
LRRDDVGKISMHAKLGGLRGSRALSRHLRSAVAAARHTIIAVPIVVAACQPAVLDPEGVVGIAEKTLLIDSLAIMLAIVIPTIAATFAFAWWFRASNTKAKYLPGFTYSGRLELIVWAIPVLVIMLLGGVIWIGSHELDPAKPLASKTPPLDVQVVSLDWKWLFIYPNQGVASVNQLVLPAGVPIHFHLTSASVMNAFFIPQLGSMIYTMNGMTTQLNLIADAPGTYHGLSSHFSGDGFPGMHFDVHAVPAEEFSTWIENTRATGPTLDAASYTTLSKQTLDVSPFTYRAASPELFQQIASQALPPGPGPQTGRPNPNVSPRTE